MPAKKFRAEINGKTILVQPGSNYRDEMDYRLYVDNNFCDSFAAPRVLVNEQTGAVRFDGCERISRNEAIRAVKQFREHERREFLEWCGLMKFDPNTIPAPVAISAD